MSTLEFALSASLAVAILLLIRCHRKQLIVRHLFIHSSDWCARKIDEIVDSASSGIVVLAGDLSQIPESDAQGLIPTKVLDAKRDWEVQCDEIQARLERNGIRPLGGSDLDGPIWHPWISGIQP